MCFELPVWTKMSNLIMSVCLCVYCPVYMCDQLAKCRPVHHRANKMSNGQTVLKFLVPLNKLDSQTIGSISVHAVWMPDLYLVSSKEFTEYLVCWKRSVVQCVLMHWSVHNIHDYTYNLFDQHTNKPIHRLLSYLKCFVYFHSPQSHFKWSVANRLVQYKPFTV